jgi:hypothetical protein
MLDIFKEMDFIDEMKTLIDDYSNMVMDEAFKKFDNWLS